MILLILIAYLLSISIQSINGTLLQDQCTQGFMDYPLLSVKASQINTPLRLPILYSDVNYRNISTKVALMIFFTNSIAPDADDGYTIVFPNLEFECSGTLTGFLLPLYVGSISANSTGEPQYPWIGIFRVNDSDTYTLVPDSNRSIILGPDDFSTSGIFNYTVSPPIQFTSGDILGLYLAFGTIIPYVEYALDQSNISTTETFVIVENNSTDNDNEMDRQYTRVEGMGSIRFNRFIVHPIISVEASNESSCLPGFIRAEDLLPFSRAAGGTTAIIDQEALYFKDINFTCDGNITHVMVGMQDFPFLTSNPPEIRIWRPVSNTYTQSGPTIPLYYNDAVSDISTEYLRWYNLSVPVPVTQGDVLGLYNPPLLSSDSVLYFQLHSGPFNYLSDGVQSPANHYPLVSVIFDGTPCTSSLTTTSSSAIPSSTSEATVKITTTLTIATTIGAIVNISRSSAPSLSLMTTSVTNTHSPPHFPEEANNTPLVIIIVILAIVLVIFLVVTISIAAMIWRRKSAKVVSNYGEVGNDTLKSVPLIKLAEEVDNYKGNDKFKSVPLIESFEDERNQSDSIHVDRGTTANESYGMLDISQCNQSYGPIDGKGESNEPIKMVNEVMTNEYEPVPVLNEAYIPGDVPPASFNENDTMVTNESYASFDMIPLAQNESYNIMNEGPIQHSTTHDGSSDHILLQSNESYSTENLLGVDIYSDSVLYEGREEVCSSEKLEREKEAAGTKSQDDNDMDIPLQPNESYTASTQHTLTHTTSIENRADASDIEVDRNEAYNNRPYDDLDIPIQPNESYTANTQHTLTHSQAMSIENREDTRITDNIKVDQNEAYNKMARVGVVSNEYIAIRLNVSYGKFRNRSNEELSNGSSSPAMYDGDCNPYSDVLVVKPNESYHISMVHSSQLISEANDSTQDPDHDLHDDHSDIGYASK